MFHYFFLASVASFNFAIAQEDPNALIPSLRPQIYDNSQAKEEKIYVHLRDLISDSEGFWFRLPTYPFVIGSRSLHADEIGTYLVQSGVRWICPYPDCRMINDDISNPICQYCKRSRQ